MSDRQERIPMQPGEYLFYTVNPDEIREKMFLPLIGAAVALSILAAILGALGLYGLFG